MAQAAIEIGGDDATTAILFSMYMENIKEIGINGKGNVLYFDGSTDGFRKTMQQIQAMQMSNKS